MSSQRENVLSMYRRQGYEKAPAFMYLCPSQEEEFRRRYPGEESFQEVFGFPYRVINDPGFPWDFDSRKLIPGRMEFDWSQYYPEGFIYDVRFDSWGIAHEDNPNSMHMTNMHHPMKEFTTLQELQDYPLPDFTTVDFTIFEDRIKKIHDSGLAVFVWFECTIWETAWYLRRMENLMLDMVLGDEKAVWLLDAITDRACYRVEKFAEMGADIIGFGDDLGAQETILMSPELYREWLKPRLSKVISAAKIIKPDILIRYHSCGTVTPLIPDLIEAGIDILNPVQPECMDFQLIHNEFGDRLSFDGTIGTQKLMPFGTTGEIRDQVFRNLDIAGDKGGLFCCPTHFIEPEVPWENIEAYVQACHDYK